jgi:hypothetical protein
VRRHAKASSVGSIDGQRKRRGSFLAVLALAICAFAVSAAPASAATTATVDSITSSYASAHVSGTIHAEGETYWRFDYSTDGVNWVEGSSEAAGGPTAGGPEPISGEETFEADFHGLKGGTKYFVRLGYYNATTEEGGNSPEPGPEFETLVVDPPSIVSVDDASNLEYTRVKVSGEVERPANPDPAFNANCLFEYIPAAGFANRNEQQSVTIKANGGEFFLGYFGKGEFAPYVAFNAPASSLQAALEELPEFGPGDVTVTGGPGSTSGGSPYVITFGGTLATQDVDQLSIEAGSLAPAGVASGQVTTTTQAHVEGWDGASQADCEPNIVATPGSTPVTANLTGLTNGTAYRLRLVASNAGGSDTKEAAHTFTTQTLPPPSVSIEPVTTFTATTATFKGHVNPGGVDPGFDTNWEFKCIPECPGLDPGTVLASEGEQAVSAEASGLEPNTTYEVKLIASNQGSSASAETSFPTSPAGPIAETIPAFALGNGTEALVGGKVDVKNLASKYWVEYGPGPGGPGASYPDSFPVAKDAAVPLQIAGTGDLKNESETISNLTAANGDFHVGQRISGPGIPAQTRINGVGSGQIMIDKAATATAQGVPLSATPAGTQVLTQKISGLSPATTYHFRVVVENTSGKIEGEDVSFETASPISFPSNCANAKLRTETSSALLPECRAYEMTTEPDKNGGDATVAIATTTDGDRVGYRSSIGFGNASANNAVTSYMTERGAVGWTTRSMQPPVGSSNLGLSGGYNNADFSSDLSKAIILTRSGAVEPMVQNIFITSLDGSTRWVAEPATTGSGVDDRSYTGRSADASHIVFESSQNFLGGPQFPNKQVWEWVNGETRLISALPDGSVEPQAAATGSGTDGGTNIGTGFSGTLQQPTAVSADGRRVFWGLGGAQIRNVFAYEEGAPTREISLSQRTGSVGEDTSGLFPVQFLGAAVDGSQVYMTTVVQLTDDATIGGGLYRYDLNTNILHFVSSGATAPAGAQVESTFLISQDGKRVYFTARGQLVPGKGTPGALNLYTADDENHVEFVATLSDSDRPGGAATPDGSHFAFKSTARLTAFDNAGHYEIYLYDVGDGSLSCVSCGPAVHTPTGDAELRPYVRSHAISDDGSHIFFHTEDALVPGDVNGRADVYEYQDGNVALISTGTSNYPSEFQVATPDGKNVFFTSRDSLVGQDIDGGSQDIYDARIDGGFPAPVPPNPCEGENCQGKAAPPPAFVGPATTSTNGKGNTQGRKQTTCKHKSKKQREKCGPKAKKHQAKKHHAKKASKSGRGK